MQSTEPTMLILLLSLGTMVPCSLQQAQSSMNRCDETGTDQTTTPCTSCAASQTQQCPWGFKKYTTQPMDTNMGQGGCQYTVTIAGKQVALNGCNHQCERTVTIPKCCADFWGPLCLCEYHTLNSRCFVKKHIFTHYIFFMDSDSWNVE
uniref:VWFD domain-containing protein n=1 Tax=Hucho hucho TaxID=62062 RepID=A0A4W5JP09_9TELE